MLCRGPATGAPQQSQIKALARGAAASNCSRSPCDQEDRATEPSAQGNGHSGPEGTWGEDTGLAFQVGASSGKMTWSKRVQPRPSERGKSGEQAGADALVVEIAPGFVQVRGISLGNEMLLGSAVVWRGVRWWAPVPGRLKAACTADG